MKAWGLRKMHVSGTTVVYGIVGDPVSHSLSPLMHNAAFRALDLDCVYVPFPVPRGSAEVAAIAARNMRLGGLNVTVPHKVDIMTFLDCTDSSARRIGAVNTVVTEGGKLTGYNTDALGFARALDAYSVDVKDREVLVLGAGGAARAVVFSLLDRGAKVTVLNRDVVKAASLARDVAAETIGGIAHGALSDERLDEYVSGCTLLVNATSVGMHPRPNESPCPRRLLRPGLAVCDIVYNPLETLLLREARECGAVVIPGDEMLVQQGALAFELWTGVAAPVEIMRATVRQELSSGAE